MKIGIIGGSGLENLDILKNSKEVTVFTPYGDPSSSLLEGEIAGVKVAILSRHGRQHTITPTNVNNKANIIALKAVGCNYIIAFSAVGSLRSNIKRGNFVIPDQFIDFTRRRDVSFYNKFNDNPLHVSMGFPFNKYLREVLIESCKFCELNFHSKGTVITIEGNRFSTKAESKMFRSWGADIINMTVAPECIMANEAKIPYAVVALCTDYDSWSDAEPVNWDEIKEILKKNSDNAVKVLIKAIEIIGSKSNGYKRIYKKHK